MEAVKKWVMANKGKTIALCVLILMAFSYVRMNLTVEDLPDEVVDIDSDEYLMERCGQVPPDGFILTSACNLLPAGNAELTPEEVGFTFLRALTNLDLETAARYSYNSSVIRRFERFFDTDNNYTLDQDFVRTLYSQALLTLVVHDVAHTATFPDGRVAITYNIEILDLLDRDFWLDDQEMLFKDLNQFLVTESDSTKAHEYLHEYLLAYYQSPEADTRFTTVTLTIDRVVDQDHWVVSDDSALDTLAQFVDRDSIVAHILLQFDKQRW